MKINSIKSSIDFSKKNIFFVNFILKVFACIFFIYAILFYYKSASSNFVIDYTPSTSVCIILGIIFLTCLRLDYELKINLSLLILSSMFSIILFEIFLGINLNKNKINIKTAQKLNIPYDTRSLEQVLDDFNKEGIKAYPNIVPGNNETFNSTILKNDTLYPLGSIPDVTTVYCNESGAWSIFTSDEHGFNNPKGLYNHDVDIILVGDSMVEGACVYADETIASVMRKSGLNVISAGKGGNGPLIELALIKEYAKPLKPKIVIWFYYENDIKDLAKEVKSSLILKYFNDEDFSQDLIIKSNQVKENLSNYFKENRLNSFKNKTIFFKKIITFRNIRSFLNIDFLYNIDYNLFNNILLKAQNMVKGWDGEFYFVYLPSIKSVSNNTEYSHKKNILNIVEKLNIPIIDFNNVLDSHKDKMSVFALRNNIHYNAEGYKLISETILKTLTKDDVIP